MTNLQTRCYSCEWGFRAYMYLPAAQRAAEVANLCDCCFEEAMETAKAWAEDAAAYAAR